MTVPDGSCRMLLPLVGCECIFSWMHSTQCILLHRCFWITSSSDMFRFSTKFCLLPPSRRTLIFKIFSSVSNIVSLNPASSWTVCLDSVWVSETFRKTTATLVLLTLCLLLLRDLVSPPNIWLHLTFQMTPPPPPLYCPSQLFYLFIGGWGGDCITGA